MKYPYRKYLAVLAFFSLLLLSCEADTDSNQVKNLIPVPLASDISHKISDIKTLKFPKADALEEFESWVSSWSQVEMVDKEEANVSFAPKLSLSDGGYDLEVGDKEVSISYNDKEGLRNALVTLYQLREFNGGQVPISSISDSRRFSYRGMHLDVARHMFSVDEVKKYIDYLTFYKYNYFHWHLTEDQGWRIEIKQYPKLQEIAAYRKETLVGHYNDQPHQYDGKKYGGYYTQEEIKDIVAYATARGIEVIPEIDIPGHSLALLSAYPELGCEDKKYEAATKWGVFSDVLCPKEETFTFLNNVFDEVMTLFPSEYVHIGGDECPKDAWKKSKLCQDIMQRDGLEDEMALQSYFIQRIEKHINSKGKKIIGWDEILEGGLAPNATVMSWRGTKGGIEAANEGHNVIMTPTSHCYFDYYQAEGESEPLAIGGYLPIDRVYSWNPIPKEIAADKEKYILGGQGNVWTEYMPTFSKVEYMALARMATLSEVLWGKNSKSMDNFGESLARHIRYWESENVNIANHLFNPKLHASLENGKVELVVENLLSGSENRVKTPKSKEFLPMEIPFYMSDSGEYMVQSTYDGNTGDAASILYEAHKGNKAKIRLKHRPSSTYSGSSVSCVLNGVEGSDEKYGGTEWQGYSGNDFDAEITFKEPTSISTITLKNFKGEGQWIYLPSKISIFKIVDGKEVLLALKEGIDSDNKIARTTFDFEPVDVEKIRIHIQNYGKIPEGRQGSGHDSWLFVDEVIIH